MIDYPKFTRTSGQFLALQILLLALPGPEFRAKAEAGWDLDAGPFYDCPCPAKPPCICGASEDDDAIKRRQILVCPQEMFPPLADKDSCEQPLDIRISRFKDIPSGAFEALTRSHIEIDGMIALSRIQRHAFSPRIYRLAITDATKLKLVEPGAFERWRAWPKYLISAESFLKLDGMRNFGETFPLKAFVGCENLKRLEISRTSNLSLTSMSLLNFQSLRRLTISDVAVLNSEGVPAFSLQHLEELRFVNSLLPTVPKWLLRAPRLRLVDITDDRPGSGGSGANGEVDKPPHNSIRCDAQLCWLLSWQRLMFRDCKIKDNYVRLKGFCWYSDPKVKAGKDTGKKYKRITFNHYLTNSALHLAFCPIAGMQNAEAIHKAELELLLGNRPNRTHISQPCSNNSASLPLRNVANVLFATIAIVRFFK